ncbi:MAG TPA: ABC transporter ATP-binding protein [Acetobacteraceae bacterium]|nr:ABC transporter ATP-binding protein [Acetobacteraceae bacterium]
MDDRPGDAVKRSGPEVRLSGVGLTYQGHNGPVHALADCSFTITGGSFACLVGPSGCGKSTLLDLMAGLMPLKSGRIDIDTGDAQRPARSAVVFQRPALFPWKTVAGNIIFGLRAQGLSRREAANRAEHYVTLVGLDGFARAYPHELSGGMAQRVGIARALALQPDLLLMDEPFAAVDAQTRTLLQEELLRITVHSGMTVVFVTHDVAEAVYLGDVVFVMRSRPGRIIRTLSPGPEARNRASPAFAQRTAEIFELLAHAPATPQEQAA